MEPQTSNYTANFIAENQNGEIGTIYKRNRGSYEVGCSGQRLVCTLSSRVNRPSTKGWHGHPHVPEVVVGDHVKVSRISPATGQILEVLPRQNQLSRRSAASRTGGHAIEDVIAANIGLVIPVTAAANPAPRWNLLDRYLVTAESQELPGLVCITKADLAQGEAGSVDTALIRELEVYQKIGYPVIVTSTATGEGIQDLRQAIQGKIAIFLGKSGVGKTSLLNVLQPGLDQRVSEISSVTGKGKHTTTALEIYPLESGGAILDTPGIREFGLWDVGEEVLAACFPEMRPFIGRCRFGLDCQHDEEPGCAIRKAVMAGAISPRRYQSFLRMQQGD